MASERLNPGQAQKEYDKKVDAVKVCGANRGPHDYIITAWKVTDTARHATHLLCRVCFTRVNVSTLYENFPEATI
jgi:hypothetical protein